MSIAIIDTDAQGARAGNGAHTACDARAENENIAGITRFPRLDDATRVNWGEDATETVRKLQAKLEEYSRRRAKQAGWIRQFIPTGLAPLDAVLPHGGIPRGAITEILSDERGVGAMSLAIRIAARCTQSGSEDQASVRSWNSSKQYVQPKDSRSIIVLDTLNEFYPPAAWQQGIAFDRLIVLRTRNTRDAFWVVDQSLRCPAIAAVIAPLTQIDERNSRRLQLAAETSGCIGLVLKPARQRIKSFAAVQMLVEGVQLDQPAQSADKGLSRISSCDCEDEPYPCRITLLAVREGTSVEPIQVSLHHETGVSSVHSVPVDRSASKIA
ncbi:MAG: hypothetical protein JSU63_02655 [Phycisphaerales bacterium]|nr:MAG: hypothetical protein JSU63_02655 [Phycisphaerales bacterium]